MTNHKPNGKKQIILKIFTILFSLLSIYLFPQGLYEDKITPFDGEKNDQFGRYVAVNDSFLITSSFAHNDYSGVVYIYKKSGNGWIFFKELINSDNAPQDHFAQIHLFRNYLFVGASSKNIGVTRGVGAVYIFEYEDNDWIEKQKIVPDTLQWNLNFGFKTFAFGDYLLISADGYYGIGEYSGKAYLYKKYNNQYQLYQEFLPEDGNTQALFSDALLEDGNTIYIGSPRNTNASGEWAGAVYVYEKGDSLWTESYKLLPDSGSDYSFFGGVIRASENYIAISAMTDINGSGEGKVYIYKKEKQGLKKIQIIKAGQPGSYKNYFGYSIAMNEDSLFVSALGDTINMASVGAVYFYKNYSDNWMEEYKLRPANFGTYGNFGSGVVFKNNQLIVGTPGAINNNDVWTGAVYLFSSEPLNVKEKEITVSDFTVNQNYPNPFNSSTMIKYSVAHSGTVKIKIYNILGKEIKSLVNKYNQAGTYEVQFNSEGLPSGVYFYRIRCGAYSKTKKMILLR